MITVVHLPLYIIFNALKGSLIVQQHSKIKDAVGDFGNNGQVLCEPIISDAGINPSGETLVADLSVRGFWLQ